MPVDMVDVAGLVPGAHEGLGMGNQFLDDLRQADVLVHVIDVAGSTNDKGEPIEPLTHDPANDIRFLEFEMDMWYLSIINKGWERFARQVQQEKSKISVSIAKQLSGLRVTEVMVEESITKLKLDSENITTWSESDVSRLATELRRQTKPMIIAANKADIPGADKNYERINQQFPN